MSDGFPGENLAGPVAYMRRFDYERYVRTPTEITPLGRDCLFERVWFRVWSGPL